MKRRLALFALLSIALLAASSAAAAQLELLDNGGLEPPLTNGWETRISGSEVGITSMQLLDPDFDYEVRLTKGGGTGFGQLVQTVALPTLEADVSISLLCNVTAGGGAWAAGGVFIKYLDQQGGTLGQTALIQRSADCPWTGSDTFHIVDVDPGAWGTKAFNVSLELDNLPGVPRDAVRKLGVVLFVEAADC